MIHSAIHCARNHQERLHWPGNRQSCGQSATGKTQGITTHISSYHLEMKWGRTSLIFFKQSRQLRFWSYSAGCEACTCAHPPTQPHKHIHTTLVVIFDRLQNLKIFLSLSLSQSHAHLRRLKENVSFFLQTTHVLQSMTRFGVASRFRLDHQGAGRGRAGQCRPGLWHTKTRARHLLTRTNTFVFFSRCSVQTPRSSLNR